MSETPAPDARAGTTPLPLVFDEPRGRKKPPRHLADLSADERDGARSPSWGCRASAPSSSRPTTSPGSSTTRPQMTDLPAAQRDELVAALLPPLMTPLRTLEADKGTTRKTLWRLFDGALVESVLMRYPDRVTMCVSSQAGCGMACPFCATGQGGLQRNMSTAEIVEQVVAGARVAGPRRGAGRPRPGLQRGVHGHGRADGQLQGRDRRRTPAHRARPARARHVRARGHASRPSGLVPRINQLAEEGIPVTLALSLHAPDDELRNELVPINTRFSVAETVEAAWNYARVTKRRVSIEYAMMRGINDQAWRADLLGRRPQLVRRLGLGARQPDPAEPDAGLEVDRLRPGRRARVRPPARGQGHPHHRPRHPRPRDRRRLRPARRDRER